MITPKTFFLKRRSTHLIILALAMASVSGCDNKANDSPASQVAAKVNNAEITVHQVNQMLSKAGNVSPAQQDLVRKSALDNLINQQLLASKAIEAKLDRTPETLMAIESAKREILARAYMEKIIATAPKLNPGDVTRYYHDHPELFADRKVFNLQEVLVKIPDEKLEQTKSFIQSSASVEKIMDFLKKMNIPHQSNTSTRASEQIPLGLLKQLHGAKGGDVIFINNPQGYALIHLASSQKMPVDEATAIPAIQRFLFSQHISKTMEKEVKSLRDAAQIEYVGAFANLAKLTPAPNTGISKQEHDPAPQLPASKSVQELAPATGLAPSSNTPLTLPRLPHEDPGAGADKLTGASK